jgi:hypothetical protein
MRREKMHRNPLICAIVSSRIVHPRKPSRRDRLPCRTVPSAAAHIWWPQTGETPKRADNCQGRRSLVWRKIHHHESATWRQPCPTTPANSTRTSQHQQQRRLGSLCVFECLFKKRLQEGGQAALFGRSVPNSIGVQLK